MKFLIFFLLTIIRYVTTNSINNNQNIQETQKLVKIEGKAILNADMFAPKNWQARSRILVDYGKYIGFIKEDGSFVVDGVAPGSYIFEVTNTDYIFEPIRVDITSKGKIRARRLNLLQPNLVTNLPYPLQLIARQPAKYFRPREEWRVTDVLMNPMVLMLLVAFFLLIVTPKLASQDPQIQQEMQNMQFPKVDMADMLASLFGGSSTASKKKSGTSASTKRSIGSGGTNNFNPIQRRNR